MGVFNVPVGVGKRLGVPRAGMNTNDWVGEDPIVGSVKGEDVGFAVGEDVCVARGARAVCV